MYRKRICFSNQRVFSLKGGGDLIRFRASKEIVREVFAPRWGDLKLGLSEG